MTTFLEQATSEARKRVAETRMLGYFAKLKKLAQRGQDRPRRHRFRDAISQRDRMNIIAEIKRASPSKGVIKGDIDVARFARSYAVGGAAAISVLTEPTHFGGSISDLVAAARAVEIPVLRKDFIVDDYQIVEAAAGGASAILLIVAALSPDELRDLHAVAADLGVDILVEVHDLAEMRLAAEIGAKIIGVNNRDLHSLQVSLDTSRRLIEQRPSDVLMVAESGLTTPDEIRELFGLGYDGFLVGETLMRSTDISETLRRLSE
ncbi:MAG TPA: indole-3-glycerol phosphate synthase TrpC [Pyrinomonadaceae bacterium]|nr:indole-3-glycerol phosphate synthase TrpC [Pyrinomonadaceae bacterium]